MGIGYRDFQKFINDILLHNIICIYILRFFSINETRPFLYLIGNILLNNLIFQNLAFTVFIFWRHPQSPGKAQLYEYKFYNTMTFLCPNISLGFSRIPTTSWCEQREFVPSRCNDIILYPHCDTYFAITYLYLQYVFYSFFTHQIRKHTFCAYAYLYVIHLDKVCSSLKVLYESVCAQQMKRMIKLYYYCIGLGRGRAPAKIAVGLRFIMWITDRSGPSGRNPRVSIRRISGIIFRWVYYDVAFGAGTLCMCA